MKKLNLADFSSKKREKLLSYEIYSANFDSATALIDGIKSQLQQPATVLEKVPLSAFMEATEGLARASVKHLTNTYSGGHEISDLRSLFPTVVECWQTFARYATAYDESEKGDNAFVAHIPLQGPGFYDANRLISCAILLGYPQLIERLMPIIDYHNSSRDGLLERLVAPYVAERGKAPEECTRHLPYFKTLKIFNAPSDQRPKMMATYLEEWYHASRREPYYESDEKGTSFVGYWSWEAAAITYILNIDDSGYRNATFYPEDLVQFARTYHDNGAISAGTHDSDGNLRVRSGDLCPMTGLWETLNKPVQSA